MKNNWRVPSRSVVVLFVKPYCSLDREGLVLIQPNRRAMVVRLSRKDVEEVYSLRIALERVAIRYTIQNAEDKDFAAMEAVIQSMQESDPRVSPNRQPPTWTSVFMIKCTRQRDMNA